MQAISIARVRNDLFWTSWTSSDKIADAIMKYIHLAVRPIPCASRKPTVKAKRVMMSEGNSWRKKRDMVWVSGNVASESKLQPLI